MMEKELTEAQRESREPIGNRGLYRMYRWECRVCGIHSKKMPYSVAMEDGIMHVKGFKHIPNPFNPPVRVIGGVFKKEELYT